MHGFWTLGFKFGGRPMTQATLRCLQAIPIANSALAVKERLSLSSVIPTSGILRLLTPLENMRCFPLRGDISAPRGQRTRQKGVRVDAVVWHLDLYRCNPQNLRLRPMFLPQLRRPLYPCGT